MDTKVVIALVGAAATIAGVILGHISAAIQARYKLREIQLAYSQKLQEGYLSSARQYTQTLYVPLTLALTRLRRSFERFRRTSDPSNQDPSHPARNELVKAIEAFVADLDALVARGAGAFLTSTLEARLDSFRDFLCGSLGATVPLAKVVFHFSARIVGMGFSREAPSRVPLKALTRWGFASAGLSLLGLGIGYRIEETLEAPLSSHEFESRLVQDLSELSSLVKEVTLGAHSGPR